MVKTANSVNQSKVEARVVKNIENGTLDLASKFEFFARVTLKNPRTKILFEASSSKFEDFKSYPGEASK